MNEKPDLPGYVVLGRKRSGNSFVAIIERSWSMDLSGENACFFWSSPEAASNFGGRFEIDGMIDAKHNMAKFDTDPEMVFKIFDVHSPDLPIIIDWDYWRQCNERADTLSGVKNKFGARNPRFSMR